MILGAIGLWICAFFALLLIFSEKAYADSQQTCDLAAAQAAQEFNVPLSVLRAVTRTETGRGQNGVLQPWPWTVNMEGAGHWFETEDAARAFVFRHFKRGARSFDVGCFQINYKWHGQAFNSIEEMFDPAKNAQYAAQFLSSLFQELGNWSEAVGAYHSRTPEYAKIYKARFDRIHRQLEPLETVVAAAPQKNRTNNFPLLIGSSDTGHRGSLVPLANGPGRSLFVSGGGRNG